MGGEGEAAGEQQAESVEAMMMPSTSRAPAPQVLKGIAPVAPEHVAEPERADEPEEPSGEVSVQ